MNYLAHLLLSGPDPEWQLGGFLGDFVKGPLTSEHLSRKHLHWTPKVIAGAQLHRRIDAHVDRHPQFQQSLQRLGPDLRRVGGIALDVMFDHFLATHWDEFHSQSLSDYSNDFYRLFRDRRTMFPEPADRFMSYAQQRQLLLGYRELAVVEKVLSGIAGRLRFATNLEQAFDRMQACYDLLEQDFHQLMPALIEFSESQRETAV